MLLCGRGVVLGRPLPFVGSCGVCRGPPLFAGWYCIGANKKGNPYKELPYHTNIYVRVCLYMRTLVLVEPVEEVGGAAAADDDVIVGVG